MANGWNLQNGELSHLHIDMDRYWAHFNYLFSDSSHKRSTYKFGLLKAILDCLYSTEYTYRGMELSYEKIFGKFAENYWNLITKYNVCQIYPDGRSSASKIELLIRELCNHQDALHFVEFVQLCEKDKVKLITQVKNACKKYVVGALYQDFQQELYGFSNSEERIWIHLYAYKFMMMYKLEIEKMNYYAWAKLLDKINEKTPITETLEKLELSTPQRKDLSKYRAILWNEFEAYNCFYCGTKLKKDAHVDHVLPWSFVKSDHLWNFVLACPKCNRQKKDLLPSKQIIADVANRNKVMLLNENPFVKQEFEGYYDELLWNIWDYAHKQGYKVFGNADNL